jgi:hypothetical protein
MILPEIGGFSGNKKGQVNLYQIPKEKSNKKFTSLKFVVNFNVLVTFLLFSLPGPY